MANHKIKMGNVKLTLSIDKHIAKDYKKRCEQEGLIISKQIEKFMKSQLKKRHNFL